MRPSLLALVVLAALLCAALPLSSSATASFAASSTAPAILALDFGSEWSKACLANRASSSIGQHLDVVINEQSARKTPALIGFDADDERVTGDAALGLVFRSPSRVFSHVKRLLGVTFDSADARAYAKDFPALTLAASTDGRNTVVFAGKDGGSQSVEEAVVQLLQQSRRQAQDHVRANAAASDQAVLSDSVLTVAESLSPSGRLLYAQLASLAGLTPVATLGELAAVAVDYAVRNLAPEGGAKEVVAFLGSGSSGSRAALVEMVRSPDSSIAVTVFKVASSPSDVGGYAFDRALRDQLASRFDTDMKASAKGKPLSSSITSSPRALAKLLREAREIKEMLSVSPSVDSAMEEVFENRDWKFATNQDDLSAATRELVEAVVAPLREVLEGVDPSTVKGVEIFGGTVRIPSVQSAIKSAFPAIALGKHVDGEEAALLGAAHYAGVLAGIKQLTRVSVDESAVLPSSSEADQKLVLSPEQVKALGEKLQAIDARAEARRAADAARNALESALNDAREILEKADSKKKAELKAALESAISTASAFVDDADKKTTQAAFEEQRTQLLAAAAPLIVAKKVEPVTSEKPSAPKKKRDRRAEHAKAQADYKKKEEADKKMRERSAAAAKAKEEKAAAAKKQQKSESQKKSAKEESKKDSKKDSKQDTKAKAKTGKPSKKDEL